MPVLAIIPSFESRYNKIQFLYWDGGGGRRSSEGSWGYIYKSKKVAAGQQELLPLLLCQVCWRQSVAAYKWS